MDIMLSHGMTSLIMISIGRGRVPLHGPTISKAYGQGMGRVGSSETLSEIKLYCKIEYSNTQQGLIGIRVYLAHN
jgi:hypothetical protein